MPSLDQRRAILAHEQVENIKALSKPELRDEYRSLVLGFSALVRSAGLCQALYFLESRTGVKEEKPKSELQAPARFLEHLAAHLARFYTKRAKETDVEALLRVVRAAELPHYLVLTQETLACVDWVRRMVQSLLPKPEKTR